MNHNEHILTTLAEECGEIGAEFLALQKQIHKALRFGPDDKLTLDPLGPPGTEGPTNREKIVAELNDVLGVVRLAVANGIIPKDWQDEDAQLAKAHKVTQFMHHARRQKALI